jgi:hypothetical protein
VETLTLGKELLTGQVAGGKVAGRNIKSLFVSKLVYHSDLVLTLMSLVEAACFPGILISNETSPISW